MNQQGVKGMAINDPDKFMQSLPKIKGPDFDKIDRLEQMFENYKTMGIQSSHLHKAIEIVKSMLRWRLSDEPISEKDREEWKDPEIRKQQKCFVYLGYTSNMTSCGVRDIIRYLVKHRMVDAIVTTAGGIEEDFMKCMDPFRLGQFHTDDFELRKHYLYRTGNIFSTEEGYIRLYEDLLFPTFAELHKRQKENREIFGPSKIIDHLGMKINNPESIYYWCHKNSIPVFSPALTDGGIGDALMLYGRQYGKGFIVDVNQDIEHIFELSNNAARTGAVILGAGIPKHHIFNSNYERGGLFYTVLINIGIEHDASDSGAMVSEGISWLKLDNLGHHVKVFSEASIVFPILVALSFCAIKKENMLQNTKV